MRTIKTVKLKDISEKRILDKEKYFRILAKKKGYSVNPDFENWFECILMTSQKTGFQFKITQLISEKRKVTINKVNYSNNAFFIDL